MQYLVIGPNTQSSVPLSIDLGEKIKELYKFKIPKSLYFLKFSPYFQGDLRTAKVKGLRELTMHHFRIRAALSKGTMLGTWSTRYSFQTTRQPPAPPKQVSLKIYSGIKLQFLKAPTVYELSNDLFNFEWIAARSKDSSSADIQRLDAGGSSSANDYQNSQIIYRLQV